MSDELDTLDEGAEVKLEKPFRKMFTIILVSMAGTIVALFLLGLVIGFMGIRPPNLDPGTVLKPGDSNSTVTTTETTKELDKESYTAGKEAGQRLKEHKNNEESFWQGFNEGSK